MYPTKNGLVGKGIAVPVHVMKEAQEERYSSPHA